MTHHFSSGRGQSHGGRHVRPHLPLAILSPALSQRVPANGMTFLFSIDRTQDTKENISAKVHAQATPAELERGHIATGSHIAAKIIHCGRAGSGDRQRPLGEACVGL